ncbi:MAG: RpiB/LacA/LacB family sugar-phosphate isomerase, partial [Clostridiales Family XIII bacterium]|nr:RpiB/LacA/LacB family sugar-phosphate isomerase [Clostridiales Family XIII bacterium]
MKIALAADHGGFELKEQLKHMLIACGYEVEDLGTQSNASVDYPTY